MSSDGFAAVALAGGKLERDFRNAGYNVPNKAYIQVGGVPMLVRVLRALRAAPSIREIRVVTSPSAFASLPDGSGLCDEVVAPGHDLVTSVIAGLRGLPDERRVVLAATDLPLLSGRDVESFAQLAAVTPCDIGYGFVERNSHMRLYPGIRHTWVHLREGTFCGGGLSVVRASVVEKLQSALARIFAARKSPLRLAALFSTRLLIKAALRQLGIKELEERAGEITHANCRGLLCSQPELAVNVDCLNDLRAVEEILAQRTA